MGLDGGTIVTRSDVLRGQSWRVAQNDTSRSTRGGNVSRVPTEAADKALRRLTIWSTCALSSQPLRDPIVACGLGRLYNKDAVLQFLLAKKGHVTSPEALLEYANQLRVAGEELDHINSIKDVMEVHLQPARPPDTSTPAPSSSASAAAARARGEGGEAETSAAVSAREAFSSGVSFVCPITHLPCDRHPCSALRPCGHVLSDRALANIRGGGGGGSSGGSSDADASCPICGTGFTSKLPIHGSPEQIQILREKLRSAAAAAAAVKSGKPEGSRKRKAPDASKAE